MWLEESTFSEDSSRRVESNLGQVVQGLVGDVWE